jgi:hypothetical protein
MPKTFEEKKLAKALYNKKYIASHREIVNACVRKYDQKMRIYEKETKRMRNILYGKVIEKIDLI